MKSKFWIIQTNEDRNDGFDFRTATERGAFDTLCALKASLTREHLKQNNGGDIDVLGGDGVLVCQVFEDGTPNIFPLSLGGL
jgi:hypothetical protein